MSDRATALASADGRGGVAKALRTLADQLERGEITAVAWTFIYEDPLSHGQVNGGMACNAGRDKEEFADLGQLVAIDCEENGWRTPWSEG